MPETENNNETSITSHIALKKKKTSLTTSKKTKTANVNVVGPLSLSPVRKQIPKSSVDNNNDDGNRRVGSKSRGVVANRIRTQGMIILIIYK